LRNAGKGLRILPQAVALAAAAAIAAMLSACTTPLQWGDIPTGLENLSAEQWIADFDALETDLSLHPKLLTDAASAEAFEAAITQAKTALRAASPLPGDPGLSDIAIAGMQKALAAVGDGHTRLNASPAEIFPLILKYFPDPTAGTAASLESMEGWEARVAATDLQHETSLGAIVVKIGDTPMAEAASRIADYLSIESVIRSGAASGLFGHAVRTEIMDAFTDPWLMRALGFASGDTMTISIKNNAGIVSEQGFELGSRPSPWVRVLDSIPQTPFTRSLSGESWWHGFVPDSVAPGHGNDILYFRYDDCDAAAWPTMQEALDLLPDKGSAAGGPSHLVIDLRFNGGGDSRPGTNFAASLKNKKVSESTDSVFILVGGATFSSAMMNAADIMKACGAAGASAGRAVLVGEPPIEPLRHYGEIRRFALPNSGIVVGRSARLWKYDATTGMSPARGLIEPADEGIVCQSFDDYTGGIDTAFGKAIEMILQD